VATATRPAAGLTVDRLPERAGPVEVRAVEGMTVDADTVREPHRHDYHELIWVRSGAGRHLVDGRPLPVVASAVTIIGRGHVHVFERAEDLRGAVVRFGDEVVFGGGAQRALPGWLLAGLGGHVVPVPPAEAGRLEAVLAALGGETAGPPDPWTAELQRHLVSALLLMVERWHEAAQAGTCDAGGAELALLRRFVARLEADFPRHHDAAHYAGALAVPPEALSRTLTAVTGRSTKEHVTHRVMVEAERLLRYTDLTVQQVARQVGFADPLYFSRAFKRRRGVAPSEYRAARRAPGGKVHASPGSSHSAKKLPAQ
jgi:AraC family transcriptional activator of pobA